jgi:putative lipoic acid-binding regulatory protein
LSDDERARALALLEATHKFPGLYPLSVIALSGTEVATAVREAIEEGLGGVPLAEDALETSVPSSGGKYASHRYRVPCQSPADVLDLYARLRKVPGVVRLL